jgi:RNA polymerase sigma-70 factor (ECF subfamily)
MPGPDDSFDPLGHLPTLRRYARSLVREPAAADDLVQDALLRAYEKRHTFRGEQLRGWLLSIVHSTFQNSLRRTRAELARADRLAQITPRVAEPAQEHSARLAQIQAAFLRLPDDQRAALHLVTVEGLSYAEAAAVTQVPLGTLMSRLGRARAALRRIEEPGAQADEPQARLRIVGGKDD